MLEELLFAPHLVRISFFFEPPPNFPPLNSAGPAFLLMLPSHVLQYAMVLYVSCRNDVTKCI